MRFLDHALLSALDAWASFRGRLASESGQTLGEYGLIMTAISVAAVIIAVLLFRDALAGAFSAGASCLDGAC